MTTMAPRTEQCTTCPQPHEQLLVGWLVGGTTMGRPRETHDDNSRGSGGWMTWPRDHDDTHQDDASWMTCPPGPMTHLQDQGEKVDHHHHGHHRCTMMMTGTQRHTTHPQPHEQLLMGWVEP